MPRPLTHAAAIALALGFCADASADIVYPNLFGNDVAYVNISEDKGLFGAPLVTGNSLVFTPSAFEVQAEDGAVELLDGTVEFTVYAEGQFPLSTITIQESGAYNFVGRGATEDTFASVSLLGSVVFLEAGGRSLSQGTQPAVFTIPFLVTDATEDDNGPLINAWRGSATIDLQALAEDAGFDADTASRINGAAFVINNQLVASSEDGTIAFVDKKTLGAMVVTVVPEPATAGIAAAGLLGLSLRRRNRRG